MNVTSVVATRDQGDMQHGGLSAEHDVYETPI